MDPREHTPRTVEEVFRDFKGRRAGLLKALTSDIEEFFEQCDPEKENLCLYGFPNEQWEVNLPAEEVPPELPEPALGINFARDGMEVNDWIALVAVNSDSWLLSVAFYFGARFGFDQGDRMQLFNMINEYPTVLEEVTRTAKRPALPNPARFKAKSGHKAVKKARAPSPLPEEEEGEEEEEEEEQEEEQEEEEEEEEEEQGDEDGEETLCGTCGGKYASHQFWICCDVCEVWFHGKCVKITPSRAANLKQYKCPSCNNNKRSRS